MRTRLGTLSALALLTLSCGSQHTAGLSAAASVPVQEVLCGDANCSPLLHGAGCQWIAGRLGLPGTFTDVRVTSPLVGVTTVQANGRDYRVTLQEDGTTFDWSATGPVDFVVATAEIDSNVYRYEPPATADTLLTAWGGNLLTQVLFCLDAAVQAPLQVSATGAAGFTRTWGWSIQKSSPTSVVTLAPGATTDVAYAVSVTTSPVDAAFTAGGQLTLQNPSTSAVDGVAVVASLGGAAVTVDCGTPAPLTIPAESSLTCAWSAAPGAGVDAALVVTATAPDRAPVAASLPVTFAATIVDGCVAVADDLVGPLGTVCGDAALATGAALVAPARFEYVHAVGPYASCDASGEGYTAPNTASFVAPSGASGSSTWTVQVTVPCAAGCTLTQGYWKTHSLEGPAPHDARWQNLGALEEQTSFFLSGQTWLEVFRTPVGGSAYYALAHQYMAAKLNVLAGASASALGDALGSAEAFFAAATPATRLTAAERAEVLALAALLDDFNNGKIGPGHCDAGAGD